MLKEWSGFARRSWLVGWNLRSERAPRVGCTGARIQQYEKVMAKKGSRFMGKLGSDCSWIICAHSEQCGWRKIYWISHEEFDIVATLSFPAHFRLKAYQIIPFFFLAKQNISLEQQIRHGRQTIQFVYLVWTVKSILGLDCRAKELVAAQILWVHIQCLTIFFSYLLLHGRGQRSITGPGRHRKNWGLLFGTR
jgi:hypothetical protein